MKKMILLLGFLLWSSYSHSQILISILLGDKLNSDKLEFGLDGGLSIVDMKGISRASTDARFNLGFYFDLKLKNPAWMVHTGVVVKSTMGARALDVYILDDPNLDGALDGGTIERRLSYFNVPIMMKYRFKSNISVEGGAMLGLRHKAYDVFKKEINERDDLIFKLNVKDSYHPLDAGLMMGVGYRLMHGRGMNLGLRYYYGLVDITIDDSTPNVYNRSLFIVFGIPIGGPKPINNE